eukprot:1146752-Pelagomonas_calceolata.AAC.1
MHTHDFAGKTTVNSMYGTRVAVLAGDFLFAQSSWFLANLDNLEVIHQVPASATIGFCKCRGPGEGGCLHQHKSNTTQTCSKCHFYAQVIKLISQVIADFANGEISQAASLFDTETMVRYKKSMVCDKLLVLANEEGWLATLSCQLCPMLQ